MAQVDDLLIKIDATTESLRRELKRADTAITSSVGRWDKSLQRADRAFASLNRAALRLVGGFAAFTAARQFTSALSDIVRETDLAARNLIRTEALLKATGNTVGTTAQALREEARAVAAATLQSTESVQAAQQVLLTFRSVTGDTFNRTIDLATDMAAVFGTSLNSSITQLGKALEDPITGLTALRRVGVSFTEDQKALIKSLAETNRLAEAQGVILDILAQQFGGVAAAEANTLAGAIDQLGQRWQEFSIQVGESTGIVEFFREGINKLAADLENLTNYMDGFGFQRFADEQSKFNELMRQRVELQEKLAAALEEIEAKWYITDRQKEIQAARVKAAIGAEIAAIDARIRAMQNETVARAKARKAAEDQAAAAKGGTQITEKETQAREKAVKSILDQARALEALAGKYDAAYAAISEYNEVQEDMARLHDAGMASLEDWTDALNDSLNAAAGFDAPMEKAADKVPVIVDRVVDEFDRAADQINQALTDALFDAFSNGEEFGRALSRSLTATFKTTVVRPLVSELGASLGGSVLNLGSVASGGMSWADYLSTGNTIGQIWNGYGIAGTAAGMAGTFGASLAGGAGASQAAMLAAQTGSFGMAGATATGTALGTSATAATIASIASVAVPLAIAAFALSKLGRDKTDPRLGFGDRSFTGDGAFEDGAYLTGPFSRIGYRGASHGMDANAENYQQILQGVVALDELVAGLMTVEEIARTSDFLQNAPGRAGQEQYGHGLDTSLVDLSGMSNEKLAGIMAERLRFIAANVGDTVGGVLRNYLEAFDGTTEELGVMVGALAELNRQLDTDVVEQYAYDVEQANRSLVEVYTDQWTAVTDLANAYDGSVDATLDLVAANGAFQQAAYGMLAAIDAASAAVSTAFGGLRQSIELDLLDAQGKYDYFTSAAEDLARAMAGMKDPAEIANAVAEINQLATSAWGGLTPEQKQAMGEGFLGVLSDVEGIALENLGNLKDAVEADALDIKDVIGSALESAAGDMQGAATDMQSAARTMTTAADRLAAAANQPVQVVVRYPEYAMGEVNA